MMMSLVRLRLLTGALENDFRLSPRQHVVLQGYIPCRLKPRVLLNRRLRPCVRRGIHRLELDCLPDGTGNEEHHRREAEGSAPRHDPTIHWNSCTINGHTIHLAALPRGRRAVPPSRDMPSRASPSDKAPPQACVAGRLSGREWSPEFALRRGLTPVAAPLLRPFYAQAPRPARLGLHSALYACPPRERLQKQK